MTELIKQPVGIKLLGHFGNDAAVVNAARWSFGQCLHNIDTVPEGYDNVRGLIRYLAKHQHTSPFRHTSITIAARAPVFIARQLGKHQVGLSWNETSRRYTKDGITFFEPEEWRRKSEANVKQGSGRKFSKSMQDVLNYEYEQQCQSALTLYDRWIKNGMCAEQARMILPQSMNVEYVWTGSLLAFAHVYNLRSKNGAQKEVVTFAEELDAIIAPLFPDAWAALTDKLLEMAE